MFKLTNIDIIKVDKKGGNTYLKSTVNFDIFDNTSAVKKGITFPITNLIQSLR